MRWLICIFITLAFAAGIYFFYQTWVGYNTQQAELAFLEQELNRFDSVKAQYAEQEEKVALINSLWDEITSVGLAPRDWVEYPLSISRSLSWTEMEHLMLLAANNQSEAGYWFMPERLRVSRVLSEVQTGGEEGAVVLADEDVAALPQTVSFETTLKGKFMIPKK